MPRVSCATIQGGFAASGHEAPYNLPTFVRLPRGVAIRALINRAVL